MLLKYSIGSITIFPIIDALGVFLMNYSIFPLFVEYCAWILKVLKHTSRVL